MMDYYIPKKQIPFPAIQWDGNSDTANKFIGEAYGVDWEYGNSNEFITIHPLKGKMLQAKIGQWIIKGNNNTFYVKDDGFFKEYYTIVEIQPNEVTDVDIIETMKHHHPCYTPSEEEEKVLIELRDLLCDIVADFDYSNKGGRLFMGCGFKIGCIKVSIKADV